MHLIYVKMGEFLNSLNLSNFVNLRNLTVCYVEVEIAHSTYKDTFHLPFQLRLAHNQISW
jgi:hypothetical protein